MTKDTRIAYQPPVAVDLGALRAHGQDGAPAGFCASGTAPYTTCVTGADPAGSGCDPTGSVPNAPKCQTGSNALIGCSVGSAAG